MSAIPPAAYNLLQLYRQHRDEIDAITDPTSLFILAFTNRQNGVRLDELAGDLGLSPTALRAKLVPLLRAQLASEAQNTLTVTPLGKRVLEELGFLTPPMPTDLPEREGPPRKPPQPPTMTGTPGWLWGVIAFLGAAAVVLMGTIIIGSITIPGILNPPTPTFKPFVATDWPSSTPVTPSATPTFTLAPIATPTRATTMATDTTTPTLSLTPTAKSTLTPTRTPTPTRTSTPVSITFFPSIDAFVDAACSPNQNQNTISLAISGNSGDPDCSGRQRSLIRFDVTKIPPKSIILNATFNAHVMTAFPGTTTITIHRINQSWSETTVTWNNQPVHAAEYDRSMIGGVGWYKWDATKLVIDWVDTPAANFGLKMINLTEGSSPINYRLFNSSEHPTTAFRPFLEINFILQ